MGQFQLYHQVSSNQKTEDTIILIIIKFMFLLISLTIIHSSIGSPVPQPFFFDQLASFINSKLGLKRQIISAIANPVLDVKRAKWGLVRDISSHKMNLISQKKNFWNGK